MRPRQLRPLAIGEIVDAAMRIVQGNLRAFVLVALAFVLPAQIAENALRVGTGLNDVGLDRDFFGHIHLVGMTWGSLAVAVTAMAVVAVLQAVFAVAACS